MPSPLEHRNDWYDLPGVAEKAPLEFLKSGWAWFVEQCEQHHSGSASSVINHYAGYCLSLDDYEGSRPDPGILTSFLIAVDEVAKSNPEEFVRITRPTWHSENAVVHRVLIQGLCLIAPTLSVVGLEYLMGDPRRFQVGTYESNQLSDSISLISAIAPRLKRDELDKLEQTILSWSSYRREAPLMGEQVTWDRESRLRLLNAVGSDYLSTQSRKLLESEKADLTGWDRERTRGVRSGFVRQLSPISKEQMLTKSDDEILKIISENPTEDRSMRHWVEVDGGWEEPGGAAAAGHEIAEMVKDNPARAMRIITHLIENRSEEAATQAVSGFSDENASDEEAIDFMRKIALLDPKSESLRSNIGYVLYRRCRAGVGLPDELCKVLEKWLSEPWKSDNAQPVDEEQAATKETNKELDSVLWSRGDFKSMSQAYFPLLALTNGYLMRTPAACQPWLNAIDRLLSCEVSVRTWTSYCPELRWIRLKECDSSRGASIIAKLFQQFPSIRMTTEGIRLVAFIGDLLSLPFIQDFLKALRESKLFKSRQAYGELLALTAFREHHNPWAKNQLETELDACTSRETLDEAIAIGLAFAASNLWKEPEVRRKSSLVLSRLIPIANENIAHAIETVFWDEDSFSMDDSTERLFNAFLDNPTIFSTMAVASLVHQLLPIAAYKRKLALDICNAILQSRKPDNDLFEAGPDMVKIALTLQRFSDTRTDGLSLLEDMLRLGLDDAFRVLRDIDTQPVDRRNFTPAIRRPRTRRKYKRQTPS